MHYRLVGIVALVAFVANASPAPSPKNLVAGQEMVDYVNRQGKWKARVHPRFDGKTTSELQSLLGTYSRPKEAILENAVPLTPFNLNTIQLPREFNALTAWPQCSALISTIADQSTCGSCWAVSTTGAMQDRMCIASNGTINTPLSAWDVLECCEECGKQCHGGYPDVALAYMRASGVVSGSNYTAKKGCKPYPLKPCHLDETGRHAICPEAPRESYFTCKRQCQEEFTAQPYRQDKYYAGAYRLFSEEPERAMQDLMEHGPLVATLHVYEDFYHYEGGVYEHLVGRFLGGHAVRVVGWGEENGTPYWLVANSWHDYWGEKGFFRIRRGNNECFFENQMYGALADPERSQHVKA